MVHHICGAKWLNRLVIWCLTWWKLSFFVGGLVCITSMEPVLWLRMSGDLLWMVIGSDSGTAWSVSSRERSSMLPGSVCFCPFWVSREEERIRMLLSAERTHGQHAGVWFYLPCYLCRSGPEAKAGWCVLLLLDAFNTGAEVKLYMEAFLWGEVLQGDVTMILSLIWCLEKYKNRQLLVLLVISDPVYLKCIKLKTNKFMQQVLQNLCRGNLLSKNEGYIMCLIHIYYICFINSSFNWHIEELLHSFTSGPVYIRLNCGVHYCI